MACGIGDTNLLTIWIVMIYLQAHVFSFLKLGIHSNNYSKFLVKIK